MGVKQAWLAGGATVQRGDKPAIAIVAVAQRQPGDGHRFRYALAGRQREVELAGKGLGGVDPHGELHPHHQRHAGPQQRAGAAGPAAGVQFRVQHGGLAGAHHHQPHARVGERRAHPVGRDRVGAAVAVLKQQVAHAILIDPVAVKVDHVIAAALDRLDQRLVAWR